MPRSRSRSMESMTRSCVESLSVPSPLARPRAPACRSRASTRVVLPWSTWRRSPRCAGRYGWACGRAPQELGVRSAARRGVADRRPSHGRRSRRAPGVVAVTLPRRGQGGSAVGDPVADPGGHHGHRADGQPGRPADADGQHVGQHEGDQVDRGEPGGDRPAAPAAPQQPAATPPAAKTSPPRARTPVPCAIANPAARPTATGSALGREVRDRVFVAMRSVSPVTSGCLHGGGDAVGGEVGQLAAVDEDGGRAGDAVLRGLVGGALHPLAVDQVRDVGRDVLAGGAGLLGVGDELLVGQPGAGLLVGLVGVEQVVELLVGVGPPRRRRRRRR